MLTLINNALKINIVLVTDETDTVIHTVSDCSGFFCPYRGPSSATFTSLPVCVFEVCQQKVTLIASSSGAIQSTSSGVGYQPNHL